MEKRNLKDTVKRLITGKANELDTKLFDAFIHHSQTAKKSIPEKTDDRIWRKVQTETIGKAAPVFSIGRMVRIAASFALILGLGILIYLKQTTTPEVNYITKTTARGQKANITLSDGSIVHLNSESSITFPESFAYLKDRKIKLTGEAFFEVRENIEKPFIVKTSDINTIVLGTSFNVNAYSDLSSIYVTLESGHVKVETNKDAGINRNFEINPGEQIIFEKASKNMRKAKVDINKFLAWREGQIIFDGHTMLEVAKRLERWYNVSFHFESDNLSHCIISGEFRSDNLQNILENIQFLTNLEFKLDDKQVFVNGQKCI